MNRHILLILLLLLAQSMGWADHVIVSGGPSLKRWEQYRVPQDQHDRWWANFIRGGTMRMDEIRKVYGNQSSIVWIVYRPAYEMRGREDGQNYVGMIEQQAGKRGASLIWIRSGSDLIRALNERGRGAIQTFDYFGHSNKHCFCLDYGTEIIATSTQWLHENDLGRIRSSVFSPHAYCKSWGCHTGESMSRHWKSKLGVTLEGAKGKTDYRTLAQGKFPAVSGGWAR
ncbi:MAG: hypothetical protein RLZZ553_1317 [Verrucomicrobiota bacterium]|jgi:hypothetical protein